jgi:1-acyl-sn-glycerol-3-phosphate acyltransferase
MGVKELEMTFTYRVLRRVMRLLLACQMQLRVSGLEHVPHDGPLLLVSNHLGRTDGLAISARLPREIRFTPKAEMLEWPVIGWLARRVQVVPIRRGESDREAIRTVAGLLVTGACVLFFPEGDYPRPPAPAQMAEVKPGAAMLATRSGARILPVGLAGSERVWSWSRGWRPWRRFQVLVNFGEPYVPQPPSGLATKATYQWVVEDLAQRIAALIPIEYRGRYAMEAALVSQAR